MVNNSQLVFILTFHHNLELLAEMNQVFISLKLLELILKSYSKTLILTSQPSQKVIKDALLDKKFNHRCP